jgi:hypothetical protein
MSQTMTKIGLANRLNRHLVLLQAGAAVNIEISTPAGQKGRFRTSLIGYLPEQYVLVQFPESNKLGNFAQYIKQGTDVTVRGLIEGHEGAVVAFVSSVRQTLQLPSRLMVLEYPKSVSLQSLRSSIRIDTQITAKVKINQQYWLGEITNLSISGCHLLISRDSELELVNQQQVGIVIENIQELTNIHIIAEICNIKPQSEGISFGVQFNQASLPQVTELLHHTLTVKD